MGTLSLERLRLPVAELGPANPLPLLHSLERLPRPSIPHYSSTVPEVMRDRLAYGRFTGGYPYSCQDGYTRQLVPRDVRVAVLDNGRLRATFLLEYGGRLWSLEDLVSHRNLLFNPGRIQLANLGMRNAWFAGGVEWMLGIAAHSPFTCSSLHVAEANGPNGEPALRMYEYERLRGVVFQIDAWLAEESPLLKVHVRLHNPQAHDVPMWAWSNAAVPETPAGRVVAPADSAWYYGYDGASLQSTRVPHHDARDLTYPGRQTDAAEYFFRLAGHRRPWVTALDAHGQGLLQASTSNLPGRKAFRWGVGPGGTRWQTWLGGGNDHRYLEVQAGATETQWEHTPLPAGDTRSWVEAYGPVTVDPSLVHAGWTDARAAVERAVDRLVPVLGLERDLIQGSVLAQEPPVRGLHNGSGWGALEQARRTSAGERPLWDAGAPFVPETLTQDQAPWVELLRTGDMRLPVGEPPLHNVKGGDWAHRLQGVRTAWLGCYLRGLLAHSEGDAMSARRLYETSVNEHATPWALRALAILDLADGLVDQAADRYLQAHRLAPACAPLAVENLEALLEAGRPAQAFQVLEELRETHPEHGRLRMLEVRALTEAGDLGRARALLDAGIEVPDLREGEQGLDSLWRLLHPDLPVPAQYDFRMRTVECS